ncbi:MULTISPECIES: MFS transporter [unclassified Endozoicomonas]|uniref:MFS transporter n=1 Tax=unclassified Endozoicomonas TaxID=2644528 RepID=UPI00214822F6|nr:MULTISPECIES: MFS transporter [unclassified Endozoicomonas]
MIDLATPSYRKATFALALGSFLIFCNLYLFQPLIPVMANQFSISVLKANGLLAASTAGLAMSLLPWAILSEKLGRYPVMMISLALIPLTGLGILLSNSLTVMIVARALLGVALAGFAAVAVAYMAEEFTQNALVMAVGTYISANSLGGISGRIFGGLVSEQWNWETAVAAMALFSLLCALTVYALLPRAVHFQQESGVSVKGATRIIAGHLHNPKLLLAVLIGGLNFALFVNLYTVMGLRLIAPPHSLPVGWTALIFLCYLSGTISSRLSGHWRKQNTITQGLLIGTFISMCGLWIASFQALTTIIIGLLLISSGAFFVHSLAYGWVSHHATRAKATATALYLVAYYLGGSLGGFLLIACWQTAAWGGVLVGSMTLYGLMYWMCFRLRKYDSTHQTPTMAAP